MSLLTQNKIASLKAHSTATIIFLVMFSSVVAHAQKRELTQAEAVKAAEQFISQNGYTNLPSNKGKLSHETIEMGIQR